MADSKKTKMAGEPFRPQFPVRSLADIRRLEETPLEQALSRKLGVEIDGGLQGKNGKSEER